MTGRWATVVFTNQTDNTIEVYGLGSNGPFHFHWECSEGADGNLPPRG